MTGAPTSHPPAARGMIAEHHRLIAMRDGVSLAADIWRPADEIPAPALLIRTCYGRAHPGYVEHGAWWSAAGYALIVQDVRGRGASEGQFYPLASERIDGADTIEWIAAQRWCDGQVVMAGASYLALAQYHAALEAPAALRALAPAAVPGDPDRGFPVSHGLLSPAALPWAALMDGVAEESIAALDLAALYAGRPLIEQDAAFGRRLPVWRDWAGHAADADWWAPFRYQEAAAKSALPMLHISGWYDDCLGGVLENYAQLAAAGRAEQRLIVGPWLHAGLGGRCAGDVDYGQAAALDLRAATRDFFDARLGRRRPEPGAAPVRLFVMGRNAWIDALAWPLPGTTYRSFYLDSDGRANSSEGDGRLSEAPPAGKASDVFVHDPARPIPFGAPDWQQIGGPDDCGAVELRRDMLVYTSAPLAAPLLVCGPLRVILYAATSAVDADWTAKILVVAADGTPRRLNDGAVRARFRGGTAAERLLVPGAVERYEIDCWATCIELAPGECIRVEIASSAFGKFDVNFGDGSAPGQGIAAPPSEQHVYHDAARPSCLLLPVIER